MKKQRKKLFVALGLIVIIALFGIWFYFSRDREPELVINEYFETTAHKDGTMRFTNHVDGYTIEVPDDLEVDMGTAQIRAALRRDDLTLEIYCQPVDEMITAEVYTNYSNGFKQNTVDHTVELESTISIGRSDANVLQWSRKKLSRVENDKNYYASVDLTFTDVVYTLFFKSSEPFANQEEYLSIAETFKRKGHPGYIVAEQDSTASNSNWARNTQKVFDQYFGDEAHLTWGIYEPSTNYQGNHERLHEYEEILEYEFPFLVFYKGLISDNTRMEAAMDSAKEDERYLELTIQTNATEDGGNMVYDVLDGEYDDYLRDIAKDVALRKHPVLMRLFNEMNGDWCPYSAYNTSKDTDIYIALYRYVHRLFEEEGAAAYCIWVWNPNEKDFPAFKWNSVEMYYPGGEYVDVVGLTGYNTGTYYEEGETWRSFEEIYDPVYAKMTALYHQPMMITEFASSSIGGDKEAWITDMFQVIRGYDRIKVAIWWNGADMDGETVARPYWLTENQSLMEVFRKHLAEW